ncbi:DUF1133 family protein [Yersinia kristensenii]|uniref:DUF1133 family protein n=1 Tax=Yersinia kristensenii TaxID=28152 RepID=UPI001C60E3E3|nr:DUF1133 family protein [Yersinia kristensenii]MBW5818889.1 DUF1133 family protein [Yersinia kristensenii]MBW5826248.1 DUF1133 family protein [Yersinia kristensenii]MBW5844503.1 DUF1133 family protein [Yersinia kristensenii]
MIYPDSLGVVNAQEMRLRTLESIWIQGKLRMWGRWSYIGEGKAGNMFNHLLATQKITKTAIKEALRRIKKAGISKPELESFLQDMMNSKQKSYLAHCTDTEALIIDRVIGGVLKEHPDLIYLLHQRYDGRGMSKLKMAEILKEVHPEWSIVTCRRRIDQWLGIAEYMLYMPMRYAF